MKAEMLGTWFDLMLSKLPSDTPEALAKRRVVYEAGFKELTRQVYKFL